MKFSESSIGTYKKEFFCLSALFFFEASSELSIKRYRARKGW